MKPGFYKVGRFTIIKCYDHCWDVRDEDEKVVAGFPTLTECKLWARHQ